MAKLTLVDDTFLRLESRRQPLHIGMLMLFEPPPDAPPPPNDPPPPASNGTSSPVSSFSQARMLPPSRQARPLRMHSRSATVVLLPSFRWMRCTLPAASVT